MIKDFLLCSIPRMTLYYPPHAPAVLKSVLKKAGFECQTIDLVLDWYNTFKKEEHWEEIDNWNLVSKTNNNKLDQLVDNKINEWADLLLEQKANWIGISIFSYESHKIGKALAQKIKIKNSNQKIFMGGAGITNISENYAEKLMEQGIIDAFITGEGEEAIIELAKGNLNFPGINNKNYQQLSKKTIETQPLPDFSDYDLSAYGSENLGSYKNYKSAHNTMSITSSRGCVRNCTYCDVPYLWPTFTHRGGENVALEIIEQHKKYNTNRFHFTDSLVNGPMKEFRKMIEVLARFNVDNNANLTWTGQFIFRPSGQHSKEDYRLMKLSGCSILEVGIESGSDKVRFDMGKKFTNKDIAHELENLKENKICTSLLFIVGYPTETINDFQETLKFFEKFHPYAYDKTILEIDLGATLRITPNTPLFEKMNNIGIEYINVNGSHDDLLWFNKNNIELSLKERIKRRLLLGKHIRYLGYHIMAQENNLRYLWSKWQQLKTVEREFYERKNLFKN